LSSNFNYNISNLFIHVVAPSLDETEDLERKISIFVTEILMPIIIKTGALVVCHGLNSCSLCVALGKAFSALSLRRGNRQRGNVSNRTFVSCPKGISSHSILVLLLFYFISFSFLFICRWFIES